MDKIILYWRGLTSYTLNDFVTENFESIFTKIMKLKFNKTTLKKTRIIAIDILLLYMKLNQLGNFKLQIHNLN